MLLVKSKGKAFAFLFTTKKCIFVFKYQLININIEKIILMASLSEDLQMPQNTLAEFAQLTVRILNYLPEVITSTIEANGYSISSQEMAGTVKYLRPINNKLFISDSTVFLSKFSDFEIILRKIQNKEIIIENEEAIINSILYTIQQSIGVCLDIMVNPNSARKHVGNRFEELMRALFSAINIANTKLVLQIPYSLGKRTQTYKCENDLVLSSFDEVRSTTSSIDSNEVIVSVKTTSKDRMGKMFLDKMLLERFLGHRQKVIGIFLNDVQRQGKKKISYTLVSGLFMVYTQFLTEMEGVYYLDLPPIAQRKPFSEYMKPFSQLIVNDLPLLLAP
jgi:hypothetical protein